MVEETKSILSTEEDKNSSRMPLSNVLGTSGVKFNSHQQQLISSQQNLAHINTSQGGENATTRAISGIDSTELNTGEPLR